MRITHLQNAINKYGWNSFKHVIVCHGLSWSSACYIEHKLIAYYDSTNPDKGYNHTSGGEWNYPSDSVREILRVKSSERWRNSEYRAHMVKMLSGHAVSCSTRHKISAANKGKPGPAHPWTGKHRPAKFDYLYKGRTPWNKGLTAQSNLSIEKISLKLKGRLKSDDEVLHISKSRKQQYADGYCPIWINNGLIETTIDANTQQIPEGYVRGRICNYKYMHKDGASRRINVTNIEDMIKDGWQLGRGSQVSSSMSKSLRKYTYIVYGNQFESCSLACAWLRANGWPNISQSTVENLARNRISEHSAYAQLRGNVCREVVQDI